MPRGEYAIVDDTGRMVGTEAFTSAPGPMGWRYFATVTRLDGTPGGRVDVSVNAEGRVVRARVERGDTDVMVVARGGIYQAVRDGATLEVDGSTATGIAYASPGFLAAELHHLAGTETVEVLAIDPLTLDVMRVPRTYELLTETTVGTQVGGFDARWWRVESREVAIAGNVVLSVEGAFELRAYEAGATGPAPRLRSV